MDTGEVPRAAAALLVDEGFGANLLADARARGLTTACPVERSGQAEFDFEYGGAFARHIEAMDPSYAKALVRYNPEGDPALNARQTARLHALSEYLTRTRRPFMFELLLPAGPGQLAALGGDPARYDRERRPGLMVRAMEVLQDAGVEPSVRKLEGMDDPADARSRVSTCAAVASQPSTMQPAAPGRLDQPPGVGGGARLRGLRGGAQHLRGGAAGLARRHAGRGGGY